MEHLLGQFLEPPKQQKSLRLEDYRQDIDKVKAMVAATKQQQQLAAKQQQYKQMVDQYLGPSGIQNFMQPQTSAPLLPSSQQQRIETAGQIPKPLLPSSAPTQPKVPAQLQFPKPAPRQLQASNQVTLNSGAASASAAKPTVKLLPASGGAPRNAPASWFQAEPTVASSAPAISRGLAPSAAVKEKSKYKGQFSSSYEVQERIDQLDTKFKQLGMRYSVPARRGREETLAEMRKIKQEMADLEVEKDRLTEQEYANQIKSGVREMTIADLPSALKRGWQNAELGDFYFDKMLGQEKDTEALEQELAESSNFTTRNNFLRGLNSALEMLGQWGYDLTRPETWEMATAAIATGMTGGTIAGSAIGGIGALPGATIGGIGGLGVGLTAGMTEQTGEIEAGMAYKEMLDAGVDEKLAKNIAFGVGVINASLEMVQLKGLTTAYKSLLGRQATRGAARKLATILAEHGIDVVKEAAQETAQEAVTITGSNLGRKLSGLETDSPHEITKRLADTFSDSAITFGVANLPAVGIDVIHSTGTPRTSSAAVSSQKTPGLTNQGLEPSGSAQTEATGQRPGELAPSNSLQVGQATTIYNPYTGPVPTQQQSRVKIQPINEDSVQAAQEQIAKAQQEAMTTGRDFRRSLTKFYENVFEQNGGARDVVISGMQFDNKDYAVTIHKNAVAKVISDPRVTPEKLAVFNNLDDVIQNGKYVGSGQYIAKEGKRPQNIIRYDYFETPADIAGQPYIITYDVAVIPGLNKYRTHKVIDNVDLTPAPGVENGNRTHRTSAASGLSINNIPQTQQEIKIDALQGANRGLAPSNAAASNIQQAPGGLVPSQAIQQDVRTPLPLETPGRLQASQPTGTETSTVNAPKPLLPSSAYQVQGSEVPVVRQLQPSKALEKAKVAEDIPGKLAPSGQGIVPFTEHEADNLSWKKGIVNGKDMSFPEFIEKAPELEPATRFYFGKVSHSLAQNIENTTGYKVDNYGLSIRNDEVKHIFTAHGNPISEAKRGQIAVTPELLARLPEVFNKPDSISIAEHYDYAGRPALEIKKNINGFAIAITGLANKRLMLDIDTFRIINRKNKPPTTSDATQAPPRHTPKTSSGPASTNSIPPQQAGVNPASGLPVDPASPDALGIINAQAVARSQAQQSAAATAPPLQASGQLQPSGVARANPASIGRRLQPSGQPQTGAAQANPVRSGGQLQPSGQPQTTNTNPDLQADAPLSEYDIIDQERLDSLALDALAPPKNRAGEAVRPKEAQVLTAVPDHEPPLHQRWRDKTDSVRRAFIDSGNTFRRLGKESGHPELYNAYDMTKRARGVAEYILTGEQVDMQGKRVGKSFEEIWQPVRKQGQAYRQDFLEYLLHVHNIDRMAAGKPVFGYETTALDSEVRAGALLKEHPEFAALAQDVYIYNQNLLQYRVDAGLVSPENQAELGALYPHYVPAFRDGGQKNILSSRNQVRISKTILKATGGNGDILPVDVVMAWQTRQAVSAAWRNQLARQIYGIATETGDKPELEQYIHLQETGADDAAADPAGGVSDPEAAIMAADTTPTVEELGFELPNSLTVWRDGRRGTVEINDGLYYGFQDLMGKRQDSNSLEKAVSWGNNTFKKLITAYNVFFTYRNAAKDAQAALLYSRNLPAFLKAVPEAVKEIHSKGEIWRQYQGLGGVTYGAFDYETGRAREGGPIKRNLLDRVERANTIVEQFPRFTEFLATVKTGGDSPANLLEAMHNANDITVNFSRGGTLTKQLNRTVIPFLNPAVQGVDKLIRSLGGEHGARAVLGLLAKATVFGIAPSIINALMYDDDEDYKNLTDRDKDNYYLFKTGDNIWAKLPKGRELSLFGNAAQRLMRQIEGDPDAWQGYAATAAEAILPPNPFTTGLYEPWRAMSTNKNWYGGEIENSAMRNLPVNQRYDERTDKLSIAIGQTQAAKALGLSPKKINYLLDQYTGILGDIVLPLLTPQAERNVLALNLTVDGVLSNKISQTFYDKLDEIKQAKNAEGSEIPTEQALAFRYLNKQAQAVSDIYAEIKQIESGDLPDNVKRMRARELKVTANGLQQAVLKGLDGYQTILHETYSQTVDSQADELTQTEQAEAAYREANRQAFGAEQALKTYSKSVHAKATEANKQGVSYDAYFDFYFGKQANDPQQSGLSGRDFTRQYLLDSPLDPQQRQYLWQQEGYGGDINAYGEAEQELAQNATYQALPESKQQDVLENVAAYYEQADPAAVRERWQDNWRNQLTGNPTDTYGQTTAQAMGIDEETYLQYRQGLAAGQDAYSVIEALPLAKERKQWLYTEDAPRWKVSDKVVPALDLGIDAPTYYTTMTYIGTLDAKDEQGKSVSGLKKQRVFDYLNSLPLSAKQKEYLFQAAGYKL